MYMMVSLELDDEDQFDACIAPGCERPKYPYGLRISLTEREMEKLRIDPSCAFVGGMCHLHAMARVTAVSQNQSEDMDGDAQENWRLELQIEDMCIESEDEENEEVDRTNGASMGAAALYDHK